MISITTGTKLTCRWDTRKHDWQINSPRSPEALYLDDVVQYVADHLAKQGYDPTTLRFEITFGGAAR